MLGVNDKEGGGEWLGLIRQREELRMGMFSCSLIEIVLVQSGDLLLPGRRRQEVRQRIL